MYGDVVAVQDLNLSIDNMEFLTILGPSGGGKSTALRLIAGLEEPTSGEVQFDGGSVNGVLPRDRNVAMVFQNFALFPHMSVFDNIAFPLAIRKAPRDKIDAEVARVAKLLKIPHLLNRKPKELSGGEQQRVALGRAIIRKPSIFLMDEPLSNLDAALRSAMRTELKRLQKELQTTLVYVTHDQTEAMTMADRIAVIKDGKLLQIGTPEEIYNSPATAWVGGFIGSPPMNLIEVTTGLENGHPVLVTSSGSISIPSALSSKTGKVEKGTKMLLGVRPEDIKIEGIGQGLTLEVEVYLLESLGDSTIVDLKVGDAIIKAKTSAGFRAEIGKMVSIRLDENRISLFDAKTEQAL